VLASEGGFQRPEKQPSTLEKLWLGDEKPDWKKRREEEEQEALDEGRGYGGLIMDQLKEVWTWKTKEERERDAEEAERREDGDGKSE